MKLRQKLAMVLASAMVVTAVPVTTMAYSYNQVTGIMSAYEGAEVVHADGLKLVFDFEDSILKPFDPVTATHIKTISGKDWAGKEGTTFYINAKDFKFNKLDYLYQVPANKTNVDTLVNAVKAAIENINVADKSTTTAGTVKPGSVKIQYTDLADFLKMDKDDIKEDTVVVKTEVEFYNAEGKLESKTVAYTKKMLMDEGVTAKAFTDVENMYETTAIAFDAKGTEYRATAFKNGETVVEFLSDTKVRVYVKADMTNGTKVAMPIMGKMDGKSPRLEVDPFDSSSSASASIHYLTKEEITVDKATVTTEDATAITVNGGTIAGFTIKENKQDVIKNAATREVVLTLDKYSDLEFVSGTLELTGEGAFAPSNNETVKATAATKSNGESTLTFTLPSTKAIGTTVGAWKIEGAKVEAKSLKYGAEEGDVNVTISSTDKLFAAKEVKLAEVKDFSISITAAPAELIAGRPNEGKDKDKGALKQEAVITIEEGVNKSLDDKRWAYFEMPTGIYVTPEDISDVEKAIKINGDEASAKTAKVKYDLTKEGYVKGFSIEFEYTETGLGAMKLNKANKVQITIPFCAPLGAEEGEYEIEVISKYMPELEGKHVIANVTAPVKVEYEAIDVKVGLEKQPMADIVITETADKMLLEGDVVIYLEDIKLETAKKDVVLTVGEGSKMEARVKSISSDKDGSTIVITIDKDSKEATSLTISGLVGTVDRTVAEGGTDIKVFGDAIQDGHCIIGRASDDENKIVQEDYNKVPTKNTEDINDAKKLNTVVITADATEYTVNGVAGTVDASMVAYNNADGRMMAPARLVGDAFGVTFQSGFVNGATVVTFFQGSKVVSFTNGSKVMNVNGTPAVMDTAAEIKNDRLFVPVRPLANALGIKVDYDNATQSATFTNAEEK